MKKIKLKGMDISAYTETLDNGLDVILIPYSDKKNYYMTYATRYGSEDTNFTPAGSDKEIKVPDGIAHFLEHKMFEQEDGVDPFSYFSESGTGCNAFTSFDSTRYICYGTKNFRDNLKFLLSYVNSPYYTDENVEKEKGIIAEELNMYSDMPDWQLEAKLRENIYHVHPRRVEIGGTVEEIMKITKEDLYTCYNNFYSPDNMFVLIVGNFDKNEAMNIIKDSFKDIKSRAGAKLKEYKEPKSVRVKDDILYGSIKVPKIGMGLKVDLSKFEDYDLLDIDLYLEMLTALLFGSSSDFRENARNKKILSSFYMEWEWIQGYRTLLIEATSDAPDELISDIKREFLDINIDEDAFERMKKVWIANEVKMVDYVDSMVSNVGDDLLRYRRVIPNKIDVIRKLSLDKLKDVVSKIDFNNISCVKYLGKEEK